MHVHHSDLTQPEKIWRNERCPIVASQSMFTCLMSEPHRRGKEHTFAIPMGISCYIP